MNLTEISESIQTSLSGLSQAKADIKSAITEKGGTVSEGAKFGDLAAAVGTISTGGGTPTKGWYPTEWDADGKITKITVVGLTEIPDREFYSYNVISGAYAKTSSINLPDNLQRIGYYAFQYCANLVLTSLPNEIVTIDSNAFYGCTKLALISLPEGVTSISGNAFEGCTGLTSITFQGTPTSIYNNVFNGCTNLLTINVPWAQGAVANAPWGATKATINYNYTGG